MNGMLLASARSGAPAGRRTWLLLPNKKVTRRIDNASLPARDRDDGRLPPVRLPPRAVLGVGGGSQVSCRNVARNPRGVSMLICPTSSRGQQVLVTDDDDLGAASLGGFDQVVVIGVTDEFDGLGGGDHDGGQGEELDEFVRVVDDGLELGVAQHAA